MKHICDEIEKFNQALKAEGYEVRISRVDITMKKNGRVLGATYAGVPIGADEKEIRRCIKVTKDMVDGK